jgi:hypothetical protein
MIFVKEQSQPLKPSSPKVGSVNPFTGVSSHRLQTMPLAQLSAILDRAALLALRSLKPRK